MAQSNVPNHAPRPTREELSQVMVSSLAADYNGNSTTTTTSGSNKSGHNNRSATTSTTSSRNRRIDFNKTLPKYSAMNFKTVAPPPVTGTRSSTLPPPPTPSTSQVSPHRRRSGHAQQLIDWRTPPKPISESDQEWKRKVETITEKYNQPMCSIVPLPHTAQSELLSNVNFVYNQLYANNTNAHPNVTSPQLIASPLHGSMTPVYTVSSPMSPSGPCIVSTSGPCIVSTSGPCIVSTSGPCIVSTSSPLLSSPLRSYLPNGPLYQNLQPVQQNQDQINELLNKINTNIINRQTAPASGDVVDNVRPASAQSRRNSIGHCESLSPEILRPEATRQNPALSRLDIVSEFDPLAQLGCLPDSPPPSYDSVAGPSSHQYANVHTEPKQIEASSEAEIVPCSPPSTKPTVNQESSCRSCIQIEERSLSKFNSEMMHFCDHLKALYISSFSKDNLINLGLVFSPRIDLNLYQPKTGEENKAIFIVRYHSIVWTKLLARSSKKASSSASQKQWDFVKINCDISSKVDLLIYNVLNNMPALEDDVLDQLDVTDYFLKISDRNEYFVPNTSLDSYVYIHHSKKMNIDITLELVDRTLNELWRPFQRSEQDVHFIENNLAVEHLLPPQSADRFVSISATEMCRLVDQFDSAFAKFLSFLPHVAPLRKDRRYFNQILDAIRSIEAFLSHIETIELTKSIEHLKAIYQKEIVEKADSQDLADKFNLVYARITQAFAELIQVYSKAFPVNFVLKSPETSTSTLARSRSNKRIAYTTELKNLTTLHIDAVSQLTEEWMCHYQQFALCIVAYHGSNVLDAKFTSRPRSASEQHVVFNEEVTLDRIFICDLPRESRLELMLIGFRGPLAIGGGGHADGLASGRLLLFDYEERLEQGVLLCPLTPLKSSIAFGTLVLSDSAARAIASASDPWRMSGWNYDPKTAMLVVKLPRYNELEYLYPDVKQSSEPAPREVEQSTTTVVPQSSTSRIAHMLNTRLPFIHRTNSKESSSSYYGLYGRNINPLLRHSRGRELIAIIQKNPLQPLSSSERALVWENRKLMANFPGAILKILISPPSWSATCLRLVVRDVVDQYDDYPWCDDDDRRKSRSTTMSSTGSNNNPEELTLPFNTPIEALQLLGGEYVDTTLRQRAIHWLRKVSVDELCDYLPQLVQSLRYETYLYGSLIWLLFEQSLVSVRFCHYFYWHLKDNIGGAQTAFGQRCQIYLNSLLLLCGQSMAKMFQKQELLCDKLVKVCADVRAAKESMRTAQLQLKLEEVKEFLETNPISIPLSPSMQVCGIEMSQCSYFNSNSLPLKIVFQGAPSYHLPSSNIFSPYKSLLPQLTALEQRRLYNKIIFKCGDDLRQDMLVMQIISIINRIWLRAGRDLRLITFGVMNNAERTGMIELVSRARTLRQIQAEYGLTGNFKTHTIDTWLKRQNSEFEYQMAIENFTHSCAGYVVITYLLGICDRHNDNIMVTTTGHLFHIDFGKFLGDAQMMAGIKRDRTPFVFTADMAYVINAGEKPSKSYHFFVDLCCQCFSLIRQNGNFLLSLLAAMIPSGMDGLSAETIQYFHDALKPELSDSEAKEYFNRLIEKAHKSFFTQFNFLLHNIAQFRFSSNKESTMANYGFTNYDPNGTEGKGGSAQFEAGGDASTVEQLNSLELAEQSGCDFSFTRQRFTRASEGAIDRLELDNFWKRAEDSEKVYYYRVWIYRNGKRESRVYRSYREFVELSEKLAARFEKANLITLPRSPKLFRTQTREMAEARRWEIKTFLSHLWSLAGEISHSDVVYTFFHQIQRDQMLIDEEGEAAHQRASSNQLNQQLYASNVCCQIKLKISYQMSEGKLNVFVSFAKNLRGERGHEPDSYVKLYLDHNKSSKRKTRIISRSSFPTYMESISYERVFDWKTKVLEVSIWEYDISGNSCIGKTTIELRQLNLDRGAVEDWFPLEKATTN